MALVSQWAGIESGERTPRSAAAAPVVAHSASPEVRLRRSDHLVLGSIDAGAHVLQRRARLVMLGSAVFMVPMLGMNLVLSALAFSGFDRYDGLFGDRGYVGVESTSVFVAIVLQSLTAHLVGAFGAQVLVAFQMGGEPRLGDSVLAVVRRMPMLLLTWMLTHWWAVLAALLMVSEPEVAAALSILAVPFLVLCTTCVVLTGPVVMTEGLGVAAIGRGYRLARARFGASFMFVVVCAVIGGLLFGFISELPVLLEQTGLITFGSIGYLVQGVTSQLALLVVIPLSALATAQLYLQLRVASEGADLVISADRAFGRRG